MLFYRSKNSTLVQPLYQVVFDKAMCALIFIFPLCIGSIKSWASGGYFLLVLLALFSLWRAREVSQSYRHELLLPIIFFFIALLLSLVNAEDWYRAFKWSGKLAFFLFLIPTVLGLKRLSVNLLRPLGLGLLLAGFIVGGVAGYAQIILHRGRAIGQYNPIIFGDLAMLVAILVICVGLSGMYQRWLLWLMPLSAVCALYAAVASATRGALVTVPIVLMLHLFLVLKNRYGQGKERRRGGIVAGILFLSVMLSPLVFQDKIGFQVDRTSRSVLAFIGGEKFQSPTAIRLLLWDISFEIWQEHPLLGTGMGDFIVDQERMMNEKRTTLKKKQPHAHSIYFNFLSRTGLLGLVTMIAALLVLPFRIFYRSLSHAKTAEERFACLGGMSLIICYAAFGLTEAVFSRSAFIASFAFFLAVFLAAIRCHHQLEPKQ